MNPEKLKKIEAEVRIGGKGTPRRKKKIAHSSKHAHETQEKAQLRKIPFSPVADVAEVNLFMKDMTVIQFKRPEVGVSLAANATTIKGVGEVKKLNELPAQYLFDTGLLPKPLDLMDFDLVGEATAIDDFEKYCMAAAAVEKVPVNLVGHASEN